MGKPEFNPDQPFTPADIGPQKDESKPPFDPNKSFEPAAKQGIAQTALEQFAKPITYGYLPKLQAATEPLTDRIYKTLGFGNNDTPVAPMKQATFSGPDYEAAKRENQDRQAEQVKENPGTSITAGLGGAVAGGIASGGLLSSGAKLAAAKYAPQALGAVQKFNAAKGIAPAVAKIGLAGAEGAAQGLAYDPGTEDQGTSWDDRKDNAKLGFGLGAGLRAVGQTANAFKAPLRKNAQEIIDASKRLGFEPTIGMTSSSKTAQNLESSLSQGATIPGVRYYNSKVAPIQKTLSDTSKGLLSDATTQSKYEVGRDIQKGLAGDIAEKYNNVQMAYEPFNQELPKMIPAFEDKAKLMDDVAKATKGYPSVGGNLDKYGESVANSLDNAKSLDDVESIRKRVGNDLTGLYKSNTPDKINSIDALSAVHDKLADFRDDQFVKLAQGAKNNNETAYFSIPGQEGAKTGKDMAEEYKNTRAMYKQLRDETKEIGPILGIKDTNPKNFIDSLNNIKPEDMAAKLFNGNNVDAAVKMQEKFPEQFKAARNFELQKLRAASIDDSAGSPLTGEVSPAKLLRNVNKYSPEAQKALFGEKVKTIKDLHTIMESFPEMVGPSGTPKGQSWQNLGISKTGAVGGYATAGVPGAIVGGASPNAIDLAKRGLLKLYSTPPGQVSSQIPSRAAAIGVGAKNAIQNGNVRGLLNGR